MRRSLARFVGAERAESGLRACELVSADLTDPAALADPRLDAATHVVHLASNTSFRPSYKVRHVNVFGALTLAHRMRRVPGLERFLYVGTAYICGDAPERVVGEATYPRPRARHFTDYTASKAECEMLLESTAPELPLVVARPSVVVGHSRLGCGPSASLFWFYRACDLLRRVTCPLDSRDDVVPADWAADALLLLLFKPQLAHRRYHVLAGEVSSVTWAEIAAAFEACHGERPDDPYRVADIPTILAERDRIAARLGPDGVGHLLAALPIYYQFMEIAPELFDNARLLAEGVPRPPKFTDYLYLCATMPTGRGVYEQMLDDV